MLAFVGESDLQVNHKNCIKDDNRLDNLEYCSASENTKHAYANNRVSKKGENHHLCKLTERQVLDIRAEYSSIETTHKKLAEKYNVDRKTIGDIINRRNWSHI
jgi:hypothetical protein